MLRAVRRLTIYVGNDLAGGARAAAMSGVANSPRIDDRLPNLGTVTAEAVDLTLFAPRPR